MLSESMAQPQAAYWSSHPLQIPNRKSSAGATNEDVEFDVVPTGRQWVVNWLALENETSNFTEARVFIKGGGDEHYLLEEQALLADVLYWTDNPIYINEGRRLVVRFSGTTSGDVLAAYLTGFERKKVG